MIFNKKRFWGFTFSWATFTTLSLLISLFIAILSYLGSYNQYNLSEEKEIGTLSRFIFLSLVLYPPGIFQASVLGVYFPIQSSSENQFFSSFFWSSSYVSGLLLPCMLDYIYSGDAFLYATGITFTTFFHFLSLKMYGISSSYIFNIYVTTFLTFSYVPFIIFTLTELNTETVIYVSVLFLNTAIGTAVFVLLDHGRDENSES